MATTLATAAPVPAASLGAEIRATLALALPLALTQLGQVAINTTDVLFLGRLGATSLAAATLAIALFHVLLVSCIGVAMATAPVVAQALGARQPRRVRRAVRQGLWVTLAVTLPAVGILWMAEAILVAIGQDPGLARMARSFMRTLCWALPSGVAFIVMRNFVTAFERVVPVMVTMGLGVLVNALLNWLLIFGNWGFPRLGMAGSGLASALVNAGMFAGLAAYASLVPPFRRYAVLSRFWRPDWAVFREVLKIGLPIGGMLLMEVGLFAGAAFVMGWIGTAEVAAHQIAIQIASTAFMVPLGVSMAATVRVGLAVGAGDLPAARRAGFVACAIGTGFMAGCALLFWLAPHELAGLFLRSDDEAAPPVLALAATFLMMAAVFQLADGLQVIGAGALRGLADTRMPMLFAALGYWAVGFPSCLMIAFGLGWGGAGVWAGLALALLVVACLMVGRFERLTRPAVMPRARAASL
jgi:MATE family multidrug resistance protein